MKPKLDYRGRFDDARQQKILQDAIFQSQCTSIREEIIDTLKGCMSTATEWEINKSMGMHKVVKVIKLHKSLMVVIDVFKTKGVEQVLLAIEDLEVELLVDIYSAMKDL